MTEPTLTGSKVCSKCGFPKPTLAFAVDRSAADGLRSSCRECQGKRRSPAKEKDIRRFREGGW